MNARLEVMAAAEPTAEELFERCCVEATHSLVRELAYSGAST